MGDFFTVSGYSINMRQVDYVDWRGRDDLAHVYFSGRPEPIEVDAYQLHLRYELWRTGNIPTPEKGPDDVRIYWPED